MSSGSAPTKRTVQYFGMAVTGWLEGGSSGVSAVPGAGGTDEEFQFITGTLTARGERMPIERGRVQGDVIRFNVGTTRYTGRVTGDTIAGQISGEYMLKWEGKR